MTDQPSDDTPEVASEATRETSAEAPMVINPLAQRQAQMFMLKTYGFDTVRNQQAILHTIDRSVLPEELGLENFGDDLDAFMAAVERLAGIPPLRELADRYLTLKPSAFAAYLYGLQRTGRLPRWVIPFFNHPVVEPGFEAELRQRIIASR